MMLLDFQWNTAVKIHQLNKMRLKIKMQLSLHSYTFFNSLMENFHTFINGKL